jgi:hypothetical protein
MPTISWEFSDGSSGQRDCADDEAYQLASQIAATHAGARVWIGDDIFSDGWVDTASGYDLAGFPTWMR